jgi:hypothetical protein
MPTSEFPEWIYYPNRMRPPAWVSHFLEVVATVQGQIASSTVEKLTSDAVLKHLRPGLVGLGYKVESDKKAGNRIRRPVLFGEGGKERVAYEVDAVHDDLRIVVEVEAGRGARGNAIYRDLIRTSLIVDARFLALGLMREYRHRSAGKAITVQSYRDARNAIDAIYASGRLQLPFEGVLLFGY